MTPITIGQRISATIYGNTLTGTVTRIGRSGLVFARLDRNGKERWFHAASVSPTG